MPETTAEPVPVTLDDEQLAQLAAAVTDGLAEYLATDPVTAVPAGVSVVLTEPVEETPQEPGTPDDGTAGTVPSVSVEPAPEDPPAETDTGADGSGTETV